MTDRPISLDVRGRRGRTICHGGGSVQRDPRCRVLATLQGPKLEKFLICFAFLNVVHYSDTCLTGSNVPIRVKLLDVLDKKMQLLRKKYFSLQGIEGYQLLQYATKTGTKIKIS